MARRPLRDLSGAVALTVTLAGLTWVVAACGNAGVAMSAVSAASESTTVAAADEVPAVGAAVDVVALAVTRAWLSYDTRVDRRPNDTARRLALPYLTPGLRRQVSAFVPAGGPGAQWGDWTRRHAAATVTTRLGHDDRPPDAAQVAYRQVLATVTLHGDGGWVQIRRSTLFVQLTGESGAWLVSDVRSVEE